MEYCFAPLEGITGYVFRNAHHDFFPSVDRYYTPFITPKQGKSFTSREWNDVLPEHNEGICVIPQILTNQAEGFLKMAQQLKALGYEEVNLNLGCPSGTVVAKKKGAGFLAFPGELDAFFSEIFEKCDRKISVKTRIGKEDPEEFGPLLEIFNRYPLEKLIIHPRVQTDYYKNSPNTDVFAFALKESKNPVCYNGDLFDLEKIRTFREDFPSVDSIMLGRGLLVNPGLLEGAKRGAADQMSGETGNGLSTAPAPDPKRMLAFHERLVEDYCHILSGERDVLFKMKELWFYWGKLYQDQEKYLKKIKKAQKLSEYKNAAKWLFTECSAKQPQNYGF